MPETTSRRLADLEEGASTRASLGFGGSAALLSLGPLIVMGEAYYRQKGALNVDARLTQGLSRINERGDGVAEVRNRAFSVMLGYSFGIPGGLGVP